MSEQVPEQAGLTGATDAAVVSGGSGEPATASFEAEPRLIAPDHEAPPKPDAPKPEPPKAEAAKSDAPKAEAPELELPKAEPGAPGKILIMPPGDRSWHNEDRRPEAETAPTGKRRISAMAAVIALAAIAGAISGALATAGMTHFAGKDDSSAPTQGLEASVARIDADLLALKASVEHTSKVAAGQHNKATDRLEKLEKAQAEPAARLARLSDAVEKLRAASAIAPAQNAAAKEVTGSVAPAQLAAAAPATTPASPPVPAAPDTQLGRLPTVQGWVLRDAGRGRALVEGRDGLYEVYAGDPLPGVGRVDAIRRQDGRWVVVTTKGLIVSR